MNIKRGLVMLGLLALIGFASLQAFRRAHPGTLHRILYAPAAPKYPADFPAASARPAERAVTRVLMIGNSYTFFNRMPYLLQAFSERDAKPLQISVVAYPNWDLAGHRAAGVEKYLSAEHWDFVVIQEYSLNPQLAPDSFQENGAWLAAEVKAAGAIPILYQTWAREDYPETQSIISAQYQKLAEQSGSKIAPVGEAWRIVRSLQKPIALFGFDGSHPTQAGSYIAACVLYATITGHSPRGLPEKVSVTEFKKPAVWPAFDVTFDLSAEDAAAIQSAAEEAVKKASAAP